MDLNTLASAGLSTTAVVILYGLYRLITALVGHRFVSHCCERQMRMGINVEDFTPPSAHPSRTQTHLHRHLHSSQFGFQRSPSVSYSEPLLLHPQESLEDTDTPQHEQIEVDSSSLVSTVSSSVQSSITQSR